MDTRDAKTAFSVALKTLCGACVARAAKPEPVSRATVQRRPSKCAKKSQPWGYPSGLALSTAVPKAHPGSSRWVVMVAAFDPTAAATESAKVDDEADAGEASRVPVKAIAVINAHGE